MDKITKEDIAAKAEVLSRQFDCEVKPIEIIDPNTDEQLIAYVKEPEMELIQKAIDLFSVDKISEARQLVFEVGLIREASNARFYSGNKRDAKVIIGAHIACTSLITFYIDQYKKK